MLSFRHSTGGASTSISARQLAEQQALPSAFSIKELMASCSIQQKYDQLGGLLSPLGYKRSGLISETDLYLRRYSAGDIGWQARSGATIATVRYRTMVSYEGFDCIEKQRDSALYPANEPYFIISVFPKYIPAWTITHMTQEYEDVDDGESRVDTMGLWRQEIPEDLAILVVGMEHDSGNRDEFKAKVQEAVREVGSALSQDLLGDDFFRTPKWLALATAGLAEGVHRIFGMGDDLIGLQAATLEYGHLVAIADPYQPQTLTLSLTGHGADYHVYVKYATELIERRIPS